MLNKQNVAVLFLTLTMLSAPRAYPDDGEDQGGVQRVLLISIDGMHAVDFENCARNNTCPHLAELASRGVTYTRASASKPSDSFPGLTNIVTGGTPKTHGAFYDSPTTGRSRRRLPTPETGCFTARVSPGSFRAQPPSTKRASTSIRPCLMVAHPGRA